MNLREQAINEAIAETDNYFVDTDAEIERQSNICLGEAINVLRQRFSVYLLRDDLDAETLSTNAQESFFRFNTAVDNIPIRIVLKFTTHKGTFESKYRFLKWEDQVRDHITNSMYPEEISLMKIEVERPRPTFFSKKRTKWIEVKNLRDLGELLIQETE